MSAVMPSPTAAMLAAGVVAAVGWTAGRASALAERRALHHQATHDPLTGLANRAGLFLDAAAVTASPGTGRLALLFVDLDAFKSVNDAYGHDAGDAVLVRAADRLRRATHGLPVAVARLGGDEFAILVCAGDDAALPAHVKQLAWAVHHALSAPYRFVARPGGQHLLATIGASVGVAIGPRRKAVDLEQLIAVADAAMYAAKRTGTGCSSRGAGAGDSCQARADTARHQRVPQLILRCVPAEQACNAAPATRKVSRHRRHAAPLDGRRPGPASLNRRGRVAGPTPGRRPLVEAGRQICQIAERLSASGHRLPAAPAGGAASPPLLPRSWRPRHRTTTRVPM